MSKVKFDFEKHRHSLNRMFFGKDEKIKVGSKEYLHFWLFLKKYQDTEYKIKNKNTSSIIDIMTKRMNQDWKDIDKLMTTKGMIFIDQNDDQRKVLNKDRVLQFRNILLLYLNFLERQQEKRMKKLEEDRNNLPIAKFKSQIIETLENCSVVLIAGKFVNF